ncbi:MAG: thioredoxin family protein [Pseudomonadota bacterium]
METQYATRAPERADIEAMAGPVLLEFGTGWCGYCRAAAPLVAGALAGHDTVRHIRVEDGSGRVLGRSFGVKLWPTLVFLKDGVELARVVRPRGLDELRKALDSIDPDAAG